MANNKKNKPSDDLFTSIAILALVIGSLYFSFNNPNNKNQNLVTNVSAQASISADPTANWYLYQTKTNHFFQVKYPNTWNFIYGGGFEGQEFMQAKSLGSEVDFKILARANKKYLDIDSFLAEVDTANKANPDAHILGEQKLTIDGQPAVQREEYVISRQLYSIVTYIFSPNLVVEFYTDLPGSKTIPPAYRALHTLLLATFSFTY